MLTLNVVFLVESRHSYRYFSTLIDEAILRGFSIELWHLQYTGKLSRLEESPFFSQKNTSGISLLQLETLEDLKKKITTSLHVDYFISQQPIVFSLSDSLLKIVSGKWCIVQHGIDSYATVWDWNNMGFEGDLFQNYRKLFFSHTDQFYNRHLKWIQQFESQKNTGNHLFFQDKRISVHHVGSTMSQIDRKNIDVNAIRKKYEIPNDKQILIYLPFPFYPPRSKYIKNGKYSWEAAFSGIYIDRKSFENFRNDSNFVKNIRFFVKKFLYFLEIASCRKSIRWLLNGWSEPKVLKILNSFCKDNNLVMVVKPRTKFPFSRAATKFSDVIIDDDELQQNPSKLQELFSIADLTVGYHSTAVLESIDNDVPYVNIQCPENYFNFEKARVDLHNCDSDGLYNFDGVVSNFKILDFISSFHQKSAREFCFDESRKKMYINKFLRSDSEYSSAAQLFDILLRLK